MKINIDRSPEYLEPEITIKCSEITEELQKLISMLKGSDEKVQGVQDGNTYLIEPENIFYFESVDKKTFMYTQDAVLETHLRLYEIEERLSKHDFFRASKSTVINIAKIKKLSPRFNGKLDVLLENDEKLVVSNDRPSIKAEGINYKPGIIHDSGDIVALKKVDYTAAEKLIYETAWVQNKLVFRSEKFSHLAVKMERWYGIRIRFRDERKEELMFTGIFTRETIQQALNAMRVVHAFDYTIQEDTIYID